MSASNNSLEKSKKQKIFENVMFFAFAISFAFLAFLLSKDLVVKDSAAEKTEVLGTVTSDSVTSQNVNMNSQLEYSSASSTITTAISTVTATPVIQEKYTDHRVDVIREYYKNLGSPLADTDVPELYIKYADEYSFNKWSLFAAISTIESADCKYKPAFNKFNCWGYGGGGTGGWPDWEAPIKAMARQFSKTNSNPSVFITWYCPPCKNPSHPEYSIANHNWDNIVIGEMQKINTIAKKYDVPEVDPYVYN